MDSKNQNSDYSPWNPGLNSTIPRHLLPLSTMFSSANVLTGIDEAHELSDFCGLSPYKIVAFLPQRLIIHELLVRVTADLSVPDGPKYEDLGINLRAMVATIYNSYVETRLDEFVSLHERIRTDATAFISQALSQALQTSSSPSELQSVANGAPGSWIARIFNRYVSNRRESPLPGKALNKSDQLAQAIREWQHQSQLNPHSFESACLIALEKIVSAIIRHRGSLVGSGGDKNNTIVMLAVNLVGNGYGSTQLGDALTPCIDDAVVGEGYRYLPAQKKPVVMNVKGASAAGKSSIRPQQRLLAEKIGVAWEDFALISPDYWRKYLLDYESLGEHYKYAAMLTGHELGVIDQKLDRYMAQKAAGVGISHLLIDRFRFDSFLVESDRDIDSKLLTRFGQLIFMFFIITPPEETVERAWLRGQQTGRYKAVDDLIFHNIEAFTGMPKLFFSWAAVRNKSVHYEFLDNSVPRGTSPRTVAFGWNGTMTILDVKCMLDIDRYKKINVNANDARDLYKTDAMAASRNVNCSFLHQCKKLIPLIHFAEYQTGQIYASLVEGKWHHFEGSDFSIARADSQTKAGLRAIGWQNQPGDSKSDKLTTANPASLDAEKAYLLGAWVAHSNNAGNRDVNIVSKRAAVAGPSG